MKFRIQLQKILSLLVLAIERQLKLKCRYHTWTPVITLETGSHRTFWRFDILTRGTVFQYGAVAVADPGEGSGGPGLPLIFRPNWGPKAWKHFFWDRLPYLRVCLIAPSPRPLLSEGLYSPLSLSRLIEFRFEIMITGSPLLSSRLFSTVRADFIARSLFRSSALTAYAKKKDPLKKVE